MKTTHSVVTIEPKALPITFEYVGQTAGSREVEVRARVSGILLTRNFKEGAVARKSVTYPVTRMVTSIEKHSVPYTTSRCVRGAYVDDKGVGHDSDGPGRSFKEGANFNLNKFHEQALNASGIPLPVLARLMTGQPLAAPSK